MNIFAAGANHGGAGADFFMRVTFPFGNQFDLSSDSQALDSAIFSFFLSDLA